MCGITGIYYFDHSHSVEESVLQDMRDVMTYRGPDDAGIYIDGNLGMAHRRLSIVGLSTGHQPMSNADESLWVVFNGEIYNYPELKSDLEKKGYVFRSQSDTEVIVHLYSEYGEDCVKHMNGMFAFVLWDVKNRKIFMARDRMGVKPLYYYIADGVFLFGSEIKSILRHPAVESRCNDEALYEYFLFRCVSGEATLFAGVQSLLPGHHMTISDNKSTIKEYWNYRECGVDTSIGFPEACDRLEELLKDAVKIRLMSEVPLGTFCSGGVDSSLVTALAAREKSEPVNTFSVGFHEAEYDESYFANLVSKQYQTTHHELQLNNREFGALLPELVFLNDEPLNFSNSVHIYAISKLAKDFVTVVLTGEGADELFLGYPRYQIPRVASHLQSVSWLARPLLTGLSKIRKDHRLDKLAYYFNSDIKQMLKQNSATNRMEYVDALLNAQVSRSLPYRDQVLADSADMDHVLSRLSLQDQRTYLISILNRQDKMSMGASIEARVPFLDYRIAEFANSLPTRVRMQGFNPKMMVKKVAEKYLPKEVIYRRKSGFGVPLAAWLRERDGLGGLARELIASSASDAFINQQALQNMYSQHMSGSRDYSEILWTSVNYLLWKQKYSL